MPDMDGRLFGSWRMLAFDIEDRASGKRSPYYGQSKPHGYLLLSRDGRMMTLVAAGVREAGETEQKQAALFRTMLSYTGLYRCEADKLITTVDVSWNETWSGTEQVRFYKLDGDRLDILTPWMPHPIVPDSVVRAILSWEREKW